MNLSVLIVDDEAMTRNLLRLMLERTGLRIFEAADGVEALAVVAQEKPDMLILDVMMPNMDGITVCERLRAQEETAELPIVLLSARTSPEAVRMGMAAGATKYVGKPVGRAEITSLVQELLVDFPQATN
ncbi:MAG: response regulator [Anaerolineales bacterium]|nr:response regulator [Anaerolineales bacterium]